MTFTFPSTSVYTGISLEVTAWFLESLDSHCPISHKRTSIISETGLSADGDDCPITVMSRKEAETLLSRLKMKSPGDDLKTSCVQSK